MKVITTGLDGVVIIVPTVFEDNRGYFYESFNEKKLNEHIGQFDIVQINQSKSKHRVLRGLHFQKPPYTQAKIVEVLNGAILDVVVDIRTDSPTFGEHLSFVLDDVYHEQIFVPRGFAHGFVALTPNTIIQYKVNNEYSPTHDSGIIFDDFDLKIDWEVQSPVVSDKDKLLKRFKYQSFYSRAEFQSNV
jgi:dTDP-4-dehydrorhamnose 3,5-epimerase